MPRVIVVADIVELLTSVGVGSSSVTVIVAFAVLPLFEVAVIVAVPFATPVTTPFETFATLVLLDVHVTVLFVAFDGETVAESVVVAPAFTLADVGLTETDVTATSCTGSTIFWKPAVV